jgi:hypothetical protein
MQCAANDAVMYIYACALVVLMLNVLLYVLVYTTLQVLELTNCSALEGLVGVESPFLMKLAITNCRSFVALDIEAIRLTQIDLTASSALTGFELRGKSMANVQVLV